MHHAPIPIGTQVVTVEEEGGVPTGSVGIVIHAPADPAHSYRVRFPDGREASFGREALELRKVHQRVGLGRVAEGLEDHRAWIIYQCVVGSRAYGLEQEGSDTDRRGIFLPPASVHWSLYGVPEQLESHATQETYWELQKFLHMALKANPNVLECLYTPLVEEATPLAEALLAMRDAFLSRLVYQTYNGYVMSQFRKMERDLRIKGAIKSKHTMHLIRLLLAGIHVLREGFVPVDVGSHRAALLAIRREETPWDEVNAWRLRLHAEFEAAFRTTRLPDRPDYERANAFLLRARRSVVEG